MTAIFFISFASAESSPQGSNPSHSPDRF